jgi:histone-lysine N-methyltransferase SETMAR
VNRSNVFRWFSRFRDGRELVKDDEIGSRPKSSRTKVNIADVVHLAKNDLRITPRIIAECLKIFNTVVLRIMKEDLRKRKLCARFVPHFLTPEQREDRITSCQDIIAMADAEKNLFNKNITGNETWCFSYDPETKRQSYGWFGTSSPRPKKLKFQRCRIKTSLKIVFSTLKA